MGRGLDKIVESVHSNTATSQEASAMSEQLKNQSGELNEMIQKFKLRSN
jgi:methyl-accepting chemotaxis protein